MIAERASREELIAAGFMRDSLETREASSYRCSGVTRDNGRPCKRLGHRLDNEGRRWCGTHGADDHIKSPVPCAGLATDGKHCRKTADVIAIVGIATGVKGGASYGRRSTGRKGGRR